MSFIARAWGRNSAITPERQETTMRYNAFMATAFAGFAMAATLGQGASAQSGGEPGQTPPQEMQGAAGGAAPGQMGGGGPETGALSAQLSISQTSLTFQSHQIAAGASAGNLEGVFCPANTKMISGACHPSYNDRVAIINQFPNVTGNTWRCGFKNNTSSNVTGWIYTLCGQ
jgi:hypothetical protein